MAGYIGKNSTTSYLVPASSASAPSGGGSDKVFFENDQTVTADYTIVSTKNAMTTGPITIDDGATVTIETGARWVVL